MRSYDSWLTDPIEVQYKKFCEGEDFNPIKDPKDAVHCLFEELFEGRTFDGQRASQALKCLVKHFKMEGYEELEYENPNVVSIQTLEVVRNTEKNQINDLKKAMVRHLNMLKYELYGEEEIHQNTVNSAIGNLEWLSNEACSEKKLTIKRG
jgi:hypothetical protein